ncbi:MAG: hypothetical protein KatS3mg019_1040 [Fimbriimonadales bacterium]|nr:MAG: hypothetical protein KatS3mg019_1040 [Fimbriimonadales bacterium]
MADPPENLEPKTLTAPNEDETPCTSPNTLTRVIEQTVARFVYRYTPPPRYEPNEWHAECLGEAWGCVSDALSTYNPIRGGLDGYLARAIWYHLLAFWSGEWRWATRACVSLETQNTGGEACVQEWVDPTSEHVVDTVCVHVALEQALAALSERDRQLVAWVWVEGVSQAEVARRMGWSQQAVSKRLLRVRATLQAKLDERGENRGGCGCNLEGFSNN